LERFRGDYREALEAFLRDSIRAPRVYVSLDIDVGSYYGTYAARYMDRPGLDADQILGVARAIVDECRQGTFTIAGLDIMEFNMHFLGITAPDGKRDRTLDLVAEYLKILT
ncbi:MAG: hypothetical protein MUO19_03525, partial [Dehalococcoidales bacterium]|nr:hypothetical protein [Dehalococcoidales bacterium]